MGALGSTAATFLLLGFLLPTIAVFVVSYRHAMRTWLTPPSATALPVASVVPREGYRARAEHVPLARRFHATIIGIAFASVFTMVLIAVALVATAIAAA